MPAFARCGGCVVAHGPGRQARALERKYDAQFRVGFHAIRYPISPMAAKPLGGSGVTPPRRNERKKGHLASRISRPGVLPVFAGVTYNCARRARSDSSACVAVTSPQVRTRGGTGGEHLRKTGLNSWATTLRDAPLPVQLHRRGSPGGARSSSRRDWITTSACILIVEGRLAPPGRRNRWRRRRPTSSDTLPAGSWRSSRIPTYLPGGIFEPRTVIQRWLERHDVRSPGAAPGPGRRQRDLATRAGWSRVAAYEEEVTGPLPVSEWLR